MKHYEINRNSWHYKLVRLADPMIKYDDESDLCSYTKKAIGGLFLFILLATIVILASGSFLYMIGNTIGYIVAGLMLGEFAEFTGPPVGTASMIVAALIIWITSKSYRFYGNLKEKRREKNLPDDFVTKAYTSWKEKTCFKITFEESK